MLRNKLAGGDDQEAIKEMSELCPSDDDQFAADSEDFQEVLSETEDDSDFYNLAKLNGRVVGKEQCLSEDSDIEDKVPGPNYLNNSFTGPYPDDMSRPFVDNGPNPQFLNIESD